MRHLMMTMVALVALIAPQAVHAAWFNLSSTNGETTAVDTDIKTADDGASYLVWCKYTLDVPEAREYYTRQNEFNETVYYRVILYKFTENWNKFNIVQAAYYGEGGKLIYEYSNPDMAATESYVPADSPIEAIGNAAQVIYEVNTNPE